MARGYRVVDRDQAFLLPPDMRDWLPADHLAWFVLDTIGELDTRAFHVRSRLGGVGREGFDPDMLLGLLIYAYCTGVRSSRAIERACRTDVAFRVLCAQDAPDHTRIARFRQDHEQALAGLFEQVLVLCARAGLGRLGVVAIDGTKIAANASMGANRGESTLRKMAEAMIEEAEAIDAAEDAELGSARGDELPEPLRDRSGRRARIRAALDDIAAEAKARAKEQASRKDKAAERVAKAQAALASQRAALTEQAIARAAREKAAAEQGRTLPGTRPLTDIDSHCRMRDARTRLRRAEAALADTESGAENARTGKELVRNTTDPDSRLMKTRTGFIQGFNAQLAVSDDQIILATRLVQDTNDVEQFIPMLEAAVAAAACIAAHRPAGQPEDPESGIGTVLADAGYASKANLAAPGPDRLIALGKRRDQEHRAKREPTQGPPPPDADPFEAMDHRLRTPEGIATYRRRAVTVEPVNGHLKDRVGLRRFSRRGLQAATSELNFAGAAANLLKLYRARLAI